MTDSNPKRTCPNCAKGDIESAGVVAAFYPCRFADPSNLNHGRKIVESKFRCRECGHAFSETEEIEF